MATYEIKISGSGTKEQIEIALLSFVQKLQFSDEQEIESATWEDPILILEIKED